MRRSAGSLGSASQARRVITPFMSSIFRSPHSPPERGGSLCHRTSVSPILLNTTPFLRGAAQLYERHGFRYTGEQPDLFGTKLLTMEKDVGND